jgi:hypothetical protein
MLVSLALLFSGGCAPASSVSSPSVTASTAAPTAAPTATPSPMPSGLATTPTSADPELYRVPPRRPSLRTFEVAPKETDAEIDGWLNAHYVAVDPGTTPRQQLFVFLVATQASTPDHSVRLITDLAATNGYHAIDLTYASDYPVLTLCATGDRCLGDLRLEILDGKDRGDRASVTRANSIENRLAKLLAYLGTHRAAEGWSQFLENGQPKWSAVVIAGVYHAAGDAGMVAREHAVARVLLFGGPADGISSSGADPWLTAPHATPIERYYAFGHVRGFRTSEVSQNLAALGLSPEPTNVDGASAPFGGAHYLITNAAWQRVAFNADATVLATNSVVQDLRTPLTSNGDPLHAPVWQYLLVAR